MVIFFQKRYSNVLVITTAIISDEVSYSGYLFCLKHWHKCSCQNSPRWRKSACNSTNIILSGFPHHPSDFCLWLWKRIKNEMKFERKRILMYLAKFNHSLSHSTNLSYEQSADLLHVADLTVTYRLVEDLALLMLIHIFQVETPRLSHARASIQPQNFFSGLNRKFEQRRCS